MAGSTPGSFPNKKVLLTNDPAMDINRYSFSLPAALLIRLVVSVKQSIAVKLLLSCILLAGCITDTAGQHKDSPYVSKAWRIIFLNPGIELEYPLGKFSSLSAHAGIGYDGLAYADLTYPFQSEKTDPWVCIITPFADLQYKLYYNLERRLRAGKSIAYNSGNFFSTRIITRGPSIYERPQRISSLDFTFCLTWGIQRAYGRFHFLFDAGPQMTVDAAGNVGAFPLMIQLNLGINLN